MADERISRELFRWIDELCEGTLSSEDERKLADRLRSDPDACLAYVRYMDIHATLGRVCRQNGSTGGPAVAQGGLQNSEYIGTPEDNRSRTALLANVIDNSLQSIFSASQDELALLGLSECRACQPRRNRVLLPALLLCVLGAGALLGSVVTIKKQQWSADRQPLIAETSHDAGRIAERYATTLVNVTNCRWDQSLSTADLALGSSLRPGESLHLLEGVAEITTKLKSGGMANLQLEGPVVMSLNANAMPNLMFGRLTGQFACDFEQFTLDTGVGMISISGEATIGVLATGNRVEIHAFSGAAVLDLWPASIGGNSKHLAVAPGESLVAHVNAEGSVTIERGHAREAAFRTPAALAANRLHISEQYVDEVLASKPLAYWRFEGDTNRVMRNEVADRLHCRMVGKAVRWLPSPDGGTLEFGATAGPGYLISDDTLNFSADSYSFELWAKPAHFHHATVFSLLQWDAARSPIGAHRMVLELCGPISGMTSPFRSTDHHPGRVRYVHELQRSFDVDCYSPQPYTVRKWQHFAAVKTPSEMRLYANGKLVNSAAGAGGLSEGLRVMMGQLLPADSEAPNDVTPRLFVGQLDEVALYDRALTDKEILTRVRMVFPVSDGQMEDGRLP